MCMDCGTPWRSGGRYCTRCGSPNFRGGVRSSTAATYDRSRPEADQSRRGTYRSLGTRATWARILLGVCAALLVASIFSTWAEINLLERMPVFLWLPRPTEEIADNDTRQAVIGFFYLVAFVGSAITFCVWIHGASTNLHPLGSDYQRFSPGWAVGWWFVPFMCLFRPYQVMSEIWRGSDPDLPPEDPGAVDYAPNSPLMGPWWVLWLVSSFIGWGVLRVWMQQELSTEEWIAVDWVSIGDDGLTLLAAILAFLLVSQITWRQKEKHQRLPYASP